MHSSCPKSSTPSFSLPYAVSSVFLIDGLLSIIQLLLTTAQTVK